MSFAGTPVTPCSTAGLQSYTLNAGPFINLEKVGYWTNSNASLPFLDAWGLDLGHQWGLQGSFNREAPRIAWAVRDGDVLSPIPEPSTSAMWGLALLAGVIRWRFKGREAPAS